MKYRGVEQSQYVHTCQAIIGENRVIISAVPMQGLTTMLTEAFPKQLSQRMGYGDTFKNGLRALASA